MVNFPNAKINLGLRVVNKRIDGYHDLETLFYPIPFHDALEIVPVLKGKESSFVQTGLPIPGTINDNICLRAVALTRKRFPYLPPLNIHLHKTIFTGGGLGGGSSDAAFTLQILNDQFNLRIPEAELAEMALSLGSDCPFFLINKPCLATGRGEILLPALVNLEGYRIVIINSGIHISTAWAFSQVIPSKPEVNIAEILNLPITQWQEHLMNDFEVPVFRAFPVLEEIKQACISQGAIYAAMSGSGSTIFGIFPKGPVKSLKLPESCVFKWQ